MEDIIEQNFGKEFAIAWNENQGSYSASVAHNTLKFIKLQKLNIESVLDVCCGSANFLKVMAADGKRCTGTEILDSYIEYDKAKYPDMTFVKTDSILDFNKLGKFDLIACNHDVINLLPTIEQWSEFFQSAYNHLNNGGLLILDYYTKKRLQYWNEISYDENEKLDFIKRITSDGVRSTTITSTYYVNLDHSPNQDKSEYISNNRYKRAEDSVIEYYFENEAILNELKKAGYRYLITADGNFSPVTNLADMNRMHIIAIKREVANK